jgi:large subunit ribosomal protein L22
MEVKAKIKSLRIAPRKVRLVVNLIRGKKVVEAMSLLRFTNKRSALPLLKVVNSAVANATNTFNLDINNLLIKEITVDEGGMLKRWAPKAFGRANPIRNKLSHVNLVLSEIVPTKENKKIKSEKEKEKIVLEKDGTEKIKENKISHLPTDDAKPTVNETEKNIFDKRRAVKRKENESRDRRDNKKNQKGKGDKFINKLFNRKTGSS